MHQIQHLNLWIFVLCSMKSLDQWMKIFKNSQIQIEEGLVIKIGANGLIKSIYIRDLDNNLIEISNEI